jgi:hypothetical protein
MDQAPSNSRGKMKSEDMLKKACVKLGVEYIEPASGATASEDQERIMLLRRMIADERGKLLCTAMLSDRLCKKRLVRKLIRDRMLPGGHHTGQDFKRSTETRRSSGLKPSPFGNCNVPGLAPQLQTHRDTNQFTNRFSTLPSGSTSTGISMSGLDLQSLNQFNASSNQNRTRHYDQLLETALRASYLRQVELASYELASYHRPNLMASNPSPFATLSLPSDMMTNPLRLEPNLSTGQGSGMLLQTGQNPSSAPIIPFYTVPHGPSKKRVKSISLVNTDVSSGVAKDVSSVAKDAGRGC